MAEKSSISEQIKAREREAAALRRQRTIECDHSSNGLIPITEYNGIIRDAKKYPATTVIHPECGAIFDAKTFTEDEVFQAHFTLESMCHQIKVMTGSNMSADNKKDLTSIIESLEYIGNDLLPYYNSMVKALGKTENQQKRSDRKVGGIGVSASQFS